jgi:hypothetical protein
MKQFILLAVLLSAPAFAQINRYSSEAQAVPTRAAPTTASVSVGLRMEDVMGYRVTLCAESGQTLSGAGEVHAYWLDDNTGLVTRTEEADEIVSVGATSCSGSACRCQTFLSRPNTVQMGGVLWYTTSGVTVSGGTTATVRVSARLNKVPR